VDRPLTTSADDPWLIGGSLPPVTASPATAPSRPAPPARPAAPARLSAPARPPAATVPAPEPAVPAPGPVFEPGALIRELEQEARSPWDPEAEPGFGLSDGAMPMYRRLALRGYIKDSYRRAAALLLGFMVIGVIVGFLTTSRDAAVLTAQSATHPAAAPVGTPSFTIAGIYLHNLVLVMVPILLFPILYWAPAVPVFLTGLVLGRIAAVWTAFQLPFRLLFAGLAPHGFLEVPAMLVGATLAWRMGRALWRKDFGGTWKDRARDAIGVALVPAAVVLVVLGLAAVIEVKITPLVFTLSTLN